MLRKKRHFYALQGLEWDNAQVQLYRWPHDFLLSEWRWGIWGRYRTDVAQTLRGRCWMSSLVMVLLYSVITAWQFAHSLCLLMRPSWTGPYDLLTHRHTEIDMGKYCQELIWLMGNFWRWLFVGGCLLRRKYTYNYVGWNFFIISMNGIWKTFHLHAALRKKMYRIYHFYAEIGWHFTNHLKKWQGMHWIKLSKISVERLKHYYSIVIQCVSVGFGSKTEYTEKRQARFL